MLSLLLALSTIAAPAHAHANCALGAYRSPSGELAVVSPLSGGDPRFTLLDGRRGSIDDAASPLQCENGTFVGKTPAGREFLWHRISFKETPATFSSNGVNLHGLLVEPLGLKHKPPLIVFVHGAERYSPIHGYYQMFYAAQGVATFFYDKRGTGQSQGTYTQNFQLLAQDAASAARTAEKLAKGRFSRLGFFGGSQGGWVAPLAAASVHADFLEVGFGCICTPVEQDQWQVDYQLVHEDGFPASILPQVHQVTRVTADVIASQHPNFSELGKIKKQFSTKPWFAKIDGQYSGALLHGDAKTTWLAYRQARVPLQYLGLSTLQKLTIPQLWVFAQDDSVAPSAHSIARLERLNQTDPVRSIVVYPQTDHGISKFRIGPDGKRIPTFDLADGYLKLLADFANGTLSKGYGDAQFLSGRRVFTRGHASRHVPADR